MSEMQQPVVVYPNSVSSGQEQVQPSRSHSDGSFGSVFIVLAVIIVISSIACFLGRLCNRRVTGTKPKPNKQNKKPNARHPKENDIEFGFDGKIHTGKPVSGGGAGGHGGGDESKRFKMLGNEDPRGFRSMPAGNHVDLKGFRMPANVDPKGFRMPGNGDLKGFRIHGNGVLKGETKHVDDGAH